MRKVTIIAACAFFASAAAAQGNGSHYVVVDFSGVKAYWKAVEKGEPIKLPKSARHAHAEGCVSVGFSIEPDGKPANLVVLRSGFTDNADRQVIKDVEQRFVQNFASTRYAAVENNPGRQPVYTYGTYSFSMFAQPAIAADVDKRSEFVHAACEIPDFPAAVARGDLVKKAAS
jgi:hypothetical protein